MRRRSLRRCSFRLPCLKHRSAPRRWKVRPGSKVVMSCGAITAKGDVAYGALPGSQAFSDVLCLGGSDAASPLAGGNCEAIIRKQNDETGTTSTTVGASFMNWRGDVALGGNGQVGRLRQCCFGASFAHTAPALCVGRRRNSTTGRTRRSPRVRT